MTRAAQIEHPLRRKVVEEMHLRRWPELNAPIRLIQIVKLVAIAERAAEQDALAPLTGGETAPCPANARHIECALGDARLIWERHSEASSFTLILSGDADHDDALIAWAEAAPGQTIRAVKIDVIASEKDSVDTLASIEFVHSDLVSCYCGADARIWSDFRIHADGYGRLLVSTDGLAPGDVSRLAQRVQELGNYRNLALLGLPLAQELWPRLDTVEAQLQHFGEIVRTLDHRDDDLLAQISDLSLELVSVATASNYRMSATAAYARLAAERLDEVDCRAIAGFPSLVDFTKRRLDPAVRTCAALTDRIATLSHRAAQFTELLRTRVETRIENQNAQLLASLEHSAAMQLQMQRLVEGVSVVAISYYVLGLVGHLAKGAEKFAYGFSATLFVAVSTLPVLLIVGIGLHIRHRHVLHIHQKKRSIL